MLFLQVVDCDVDLRMTKAYSIKKRLCPDHLQAQAVKRRGSGNSWWRFCQQARAGQCSSSGSNSSKGLPAQRLSDSLVL
jgi:hypothetical protein